MSRLDTETDTRNRNAVPPDRDVVPAPVRSRAIALLGAGATAIVVVGVLLTLSRPAAHTHPNPNPSVPVLITAAPVPTQTTVALDITNRLTMGATRTSAMTVGPGVVWIATLGRTSGDAGMLIRVDATTARATSSWAVGGDPIAVAADGDFVWVANGDGDGSRPLPGENTVEQFNAFTGTVVNVYAVSDPRGLVANPASALAISSTTGNRTALSLLAGGERRVIGTLSGTLEVPLSSLSPDVAVAACSNQVFVALSTIVASGSSVTVSALSPDGGAVRTVASIPSDYAAALTCDDTDLFLIGAAGDGNASIARLSLAGGDLKRLWEGPYPISMAFLSGRLWIAYSDDALNESLLTSLDPVTGVAGPTRSVLPPPKPGEPDLVIPDATGLWVAASLGNTLLHVATHAAS